MAIRRESRLAARRRTRRRVLGALGAFLLLAVFAGTLYAFWLPEFRVEEIKISEPAASDTKALVRTALSGTYVGIVPRDSIVFLSKPTVRQAILSAHPEASAVSISRSGFTSLSISVSMRIPVARWCGTVSTSNADCYVFDGGGFIFASSTTSSALLKLFAPLQNTFMASSTPIGNSIQGSSHIAKLLMFSRELRDYAPPAISATIRDDEVDFILPSSTRITYVLGNEDVAAALAAATLPSLNLSDDSIEYVDLRFSGKAYLKRRE